MHNDLCEKLELLDAARRQVLETPQVRSTISASSSPCLDAEVTTTMQVDALQKLRFLGIMTAKLYNLLLPLFEDPHIRVRSALCALCGSLKIADELVGGKLVNLVRYDSSSHVKVLAIAALRSIGRVNETLVGTLIWSFRYESDEDVRIEACRALLQLELFSREDAKQALLDRHLLEKGKRAQRAIRLAMTRVGLRLDAELETATKIREEVQRLCTKSRISALILQNDARNSLEKDARRLLQNPISSSESLKVQREQHSKKVWEDLKVKIERLSQKMAGETEQQDAMGDSDSIVAASDEQTDFNGIEHEQTLFPSRPQTQYVFMFSQLFFHFVYSLLKLLISASIIIIHAFGSSSD